MRRWPRSCRCSTARAAPAGLSDITYSVAGPLSATSTPTHGSPLRVRRRAATAPASAPTRPPPPAAGEAADVDVLGVDAHEHDPLDGVMSRALEVGVVAVAVPGPLGGEEQQV